MKLKHFIMLAALLQVKLNLGQTIPEKFFGNNAWYTVYTPYDPAINGINIPNHASTDAFLKYIQDVANSGAKFCRIGGSNANKEGNSANPTNLTKQQALYLAIKIRQYGMEPIIGVPYGNPGLNNANLLLWANKAEEMVDFINNINVGSVPGGKVTHWIIANEPDHDYNYNLNTPATNGLIANHIKQFAIEMRKADASIKIIGPEMAQYTPKTYFSGSYSGTPFDGLMDGATNDITGLIPATDVLINQYPLMYRVSPLLITYPFITMGPQRPEQPCVITYTPPMICLKFTMG